MCHDSELALVVRESKVKLGGKERARERLKKGAQEGASYVCHGSRVHTCVMTRELALVV